MSVVLQGLNFDDHTDGSFSEVMSQLDLDSRLPLGAKDEISRSLNVQGEAESRKSDAQFVFQGQCLVLGDATVGKTSLVKSLTGKPFDAGEPRTQGIESSLVDRKWTNLDINEGLKFGAFRRFLKASISLFAMYGPGKTQETTVEIIHFKPLRYYLIISILMWSIILYSHYARLLDKPSIQLHIFFISLIIFDLSIKLKVLMGNLIIFAKVFSIIRLHEVVMGIAFVHVVAGYVKSIDSGKIIFSCSNFVNEQSVAFDLFLTVSALSAFIGITVSLNSFLYEYMMNIWFSSTGQRLSIVKDQRNIPGQKESVNVNFFLLLHIVRPSLASLFSGIFFGGPLESFTDFYDCNPRLLIQFANIAICIALIQQLVYCLRFRSAISLVHAIVPFISAYFLFYTSSFYVAVLVVLFNRVVCADWSYIYLFLNLDYDNIVQRNITFLNIFKGFLNRKKLKFALNEKFSSLKLKILDFAGDKEYYAYHHMFLRSQAIYIIVFNIECFVQDNFRNITEKIQRLCFWLESVCVHVQSKMPIFLVGTHSGNNDETCIRALHDHLHRQLWHSFCDDLVMNKTEKLIFFPVENSKGQTDPGIQILKERIVSIAEYYKRTIGCDIPYSWIKIQDAIIDRRKKEKVKFCVTLEEFSTSFDKLICSKWSKETLKYFHEKGLVIYVDRDPELCKWVLFKPEILVDIIIQLVTPPPEDVEQHGFRTDWMLLHNKGMLTESLLKHILSNVQENEEAMTAFLVAYDLICPLSHSCINRSKDTSQGEEQHQVTHFVPSLLPLSADRNTSVWNDAPEDKKFYVFFERFLPEPLFHRLLSRAHKLSAGEFRKGQPILFRDVGRFWMSCWQPYRLRLLKEENMIEVTFSCSSKDRMKPSNVLLQVNTMVEGICMRDFPFVKFHCGPACPSDRCPGHQEDFTSMSCGQQSGTRRHVFNVMPARKDDVMISLYCVNHNFEDQLRAWLP